MNNIQDKDKEELETIDEIAKGILAMKKREQNLIQENQLLKAKVDYLENNSSSICGFPWDSPYQDGVETGKSESRKYVNQLEKTIQQIYRIHYPQRMDSKSDETCEICEVVINKEDLL